MRKNHIWFSELLGLILVIIILSALIILGSIVFSNNNAIRKNRHSISQAKAERLILSHTLNELKEKEKIATALDTFSLGRLSDEILWSLVELVYHNSKTYGYDPLLVLAVIHVESLFDPEAKGKYRNGEYSGAFGLMQLKVETAKEVADALGIAFTKKEELFVPEINIPLGVAYLTQQITLFKSLKLGILAYNQGPGTIQNILDKKYKLSIRYYNKVLQSYFKLKEMGEL